MNINENLPPIELPNGRKIGYGQPCFVVAEVGQNHNGDVYTALRLMKAAHDAGVNAIKLCKRDIESDLTTEAYNRPYQGPQSFGKTYGEHREKLELLPKDYAHLKDRLRYNEWPEILFATACDKKSVDDLEGAINPPLYKVASRDLDNIPLLRYISRLNKPMILSTGLVDDESVIAEALDAIEVPVVLLVCTSQYPTEPENVGLWRLAYYYEKYKVLVGMSDHTSGIVSAQAAATLGACIIEKHITLSRAMKGTDHAASLEPDGITRLVRNIRLVETMKEIHPFPQVLLDSQRKLGRSLTTTREIKQGEIIQDDDLCLKSPGCGLHWRDRRRVIGAKAARTIPADTTICQEDIEA